MHAEAPAALPLLSFAQGPSAAPKPNDSSIRIMDQPEMMFAVHVFAGQPTEDNVLWRVGRLITDLRKDGLEPITAAAAAGGGGRDGGSGSMRVAAAAAAPAGSGAAGAGSNSNGGGGGVAAVAGSGGGGSSGIAYWVLAEYNWPFTLGPWRRNEILIPIKPESFDLLAESSYYF